MNEAKFDTFEEMSSKCSHLVGLDSLILNQTTVSDIYSRYDKEQIKKLANDVVVKKLSVRQLEDMTNSPVDFHRKKEIRRRFRTIF